MALTKVWRRLSKMVKMLHPRKQNPQAIDLYMATTSDVKHPPKPVALIILDGWGHSEDPTDNAIMAADTPNWDGYRKRYTHMLISGSGQDVGLPEGQMGNSEVGHLNLGAGRVVPQDFTRISQSISSGEFNDNPAIAQAIRSAVVADKAVHIMGLLSPGGVHSHEKHIFASIKMAAKLGAKQIYLHAFLDGRDMPPRSARPSLERAAALFEELGVGQIASLAGRYYAMDRDNRWDRVALAYNMLTTSSQASDFNALEALEHAYAADISDEFVKPIMLSGGQSIADGDAVLFMNYRADRARELTRAFVTPEFDDFDRGQALALAGFVTLTQYAADILTPSAFPPLTMTNVLGEHLQNLGKKQLRIAETEKYAHVTFFFNGGVEEPFDGESRILIASPDVATYDLQPEMSAAELTDQLVSAIENKEHDVIVCNFANPDMVGHTGNFAATVKAIEALDVCLGRIVAALNSVGGEALITADHGNAEKMADSSTGQAHTAHTSEPVPLLHIGRASKPLVDDGVLSDIAPTLLYLMDATVPHEMSGRQLLELVD